MPQKCDMYSLRPKAPLQKIVIQTVCPVLQLSQPWKLVPGTAVAVVGVGN